jgi:hypothetical protein
MSIGYSYEYFRKEVRFWPGVPQPVDLPGHPRWLSSDWQLLGRESPQQFRKSRVVPSS